MLCFFFFTIFFYITCLHTVNAGFPNTSREFSRTENLVEDIYRLYWNVEVDNVTIEVQVKTKGWVGFGISPNGDMKGSDVIIGWIKDGIPFFQDRYATEYALPQKDVRQDWYLIQGHETDTHTSLTFTRQLRNCDQHDKNIEFDDVNVIFAWNDEDPTSENDIPKHTTRSSKVINFMEEKPKQDLPSDVQIHTFSSGNYEVPDYPTTYYHRFLALPEELENKEHYIVRMENDILDGNEGLVHHLVLSACEPHVTTDWVNRTFITVPRTEWPRDIPINIMYGCLQTVYAWAVGGKKFVLPEDVGIKFGGPGYARVLQLDVHYDNPSRKKGQLDLSGLKIFTTSTKPKHVASVMPVGYTTQKDTELIPPGQKRFYHFGICPRECLGKSFAENNLTEIHVFALFQHSHLTGRSMRTRHFRDGQELTPIMTEWNYDFNFQQTRTLQKPVKILPGDDIVVECGLESTNRNFTTVGGEDSFKEMCTTFLFYYPYTPNFQVFCMSEVSRAQIASTLGYTNATQVGQTAMVYDTTSKTWKNLSDITDDTNTWTEANVKALQEVYRNFTPRTFCGSRFMGLTRRFTISLPDTNEGYCNLDQPRTTVDPYAITSEQPGTTVDPYAAGAVTTTCRPMILSCFIFIVTIYINV